MSAGNHGALSLAAFGCHLDGVTDDAPCITAAVSALCSAGQGGGTLNFPAAKIAVSTVTIPCSGVSLRGVGHGDRDQNSAGTQIVPLPNTTSAAVFAFNVTSYNNNAFGLTNAPSNSSRYSYGGEVSYMGFEDSSNNGTRNGPEVRFTHCEGCFAHHLYFWNPFGAVWIYGGIQNHVSDVIVDQLAVVPGATAFSFSGSDDGQGCTSPVAPQCPDKADVATFDHIYVGSAGTTNLNNLPTCFSNIGFAQTLQITNVECDGVSHGLYVDCSTSVHTTIYYCPGYITLTDFESESSGGNNVELHDVSLVSLQDTYLRGTPGQTGNLVTFTPTRFVENSTLNIRGGYYNIAGGSCIYAYAQAIHVTDVSVITDCGTYGSTSTNPYYAVEVGTGTSAAGTGKTGHNIIEGNNFCTDQFGSPSPSPMAGVLINPGASATIANNNVMINCSYNSVLDNSGGTDNITTPNITQ